MFTSLIFKKLLSCCLNEMMLSSFWTRMQFQVQQFYERIVALFYLNSVTLNSYEILLSVKSKIKTINPIFV